MIVGPITITVRKFGSGPGEDLREMAPAVLNAANGRGGDGATFVLDAALGTDRVLRPGDVSGPVLMRFRVKDPLQIRTCILSSAAIGRRPEMCDSRCA